MDEILQCKCGDRDKLMLHLKKLQLRDNFDDKLYCVGRIRRVIAFINCGSFFKKLL